MSALVCISFITPEQHNHSMKYGGRRYFRAGAWGSGCSITKGVRNPNLWHAAVDNVLLPQIPLLTSDKTPTGATLK